MSGVRTKDDVLAAAAALDKVRSKFKTPCKRYSLDFDVKITSESVECIACANGVTVSVPGGIPEKSINKSVTADFVKQQMSKLGATVFSVGKIECEIERGLSLSAAAVNQLRRDAVDAVSREIITINKRRSYDKSS